MSPADQTRIAPRPLPVHNAATIAGSELRAGAKCFASSVSVHRNEASGTTDMAGCARNLVELITSSSADGDDRIEMLYHFQGVLDAISMDPRWVDSNIAKQLSSALDEWQSDPKRGYMSVLEVLSLIRMTERLRASLAPSSEGGWRLLILWRDAIGRS